MNKNQKKTKQNEDVESKNQRKFTSIIPYHYGDTTEIESKWNGSFRFIIVADPMLGLRKFLGKRHPGIWRSKCSNNECKLDFKSDKELLDLTVNLINKKNPKPRFVAFIGNRVFIKKKQPQVLKNIRKSEETEDQVEESYYNYFFEAISRISEDIKVICVRGEHESSLESYKNQFGHSFYSFHCSGVLFLVLDSNLFWTENHPEGLEQRIWFERQLVWARDIWRCRVIILQHRPWHLAPLNENLRNSWLKLFKSSGVIAILSGFILRNSSTMEGPIACISSTSICTPLGLNTPEICVLHVNYSEVTHLFESIGKTPQDVADDYGSWEEESNCFFS